MNYNLFVEVCLYKLTLTHVQILNNSTQVSFFHIYLIIILGKITPVYVLNLSNFLQVLTISYRDCIHIICHLRRSIGQIDRL